jgi:WD40 repeat protein
MHARCRISFLPRLVAVALLACLHLGHALSSENATPPLAAAGPIRQLGSSEFRLTCEDGFERPFCFSPDGKMIAGANGDEVRIWLFPQGQLLHDLTDQIDSQCIAFSSNGEELVVFERREMVICRFSVQSGKLLHKTPLLEADRPKTATHYWLSDNGRWLCRTPQFMVWDTSNGEVQPIEAPEPFPAYHARVSREGVLTLWDQSAVECRDIKTGKRLRQSNLYNQLYSPIGNAEGTLLAGYSRDESAIVFWNPLAEKRVGGKVPVGDRDWHPEQAALSADGNRFVYWIDRGEWVLDRHVAVFDVATGKLVNAFAPPDTYWINEPVISPDGRYVFLSGDRSVFTPIDVSTGLPIADIPDHVSTVESLSFTPNGETLLVGSRDKRQAWSVTSGTPGTVFERWCHTPPYVAAIDENRAIISGLRDGGIRIQDIATGNVERHFEHGQHLTAFQLAADRESGVGILSQPSNPVIKRWDLATGKVLASRTMPQSQHGLLHYGLYAFGDLTLNGSRLLRFDYGQSANKRLGWDRIPLLLEDWTSQQITDRLPYHANLPHFFVSAASDETIAMVAADDWNVAYKTKTTGSTYLWATDLPTGKERFRVTRKRKEYYSAFSNVAISRDTRLIATVRQRNRIELWNGFTGELLQQLEAPNAVTVIEFSDDGATLASGHQDGRVYLWDSKAAYELVIYE